MNSELSNRFPTPPIPPMNTAEQVWQAANYTCGTYDAETDAAAAFDALVPTDLFTIHRQVYGHLTWALHGQREGTRVIIDRVLEPTDDAIHLGWTHGLLGIELKRSHEKVGRPINQMLDYLRSTFNLHSEPVRLGYALLWPYHGPGGGKMESVFHGQRLGYAFPGEDRLELHRGGVNPSNFLCEDIVFGFLMPAPVAVSHKVGSR